MPDQNGITWDDEQTQVSPSDIKWDDEAPQVQGPIRPSGVGDVASAAQRHLNAIRAGADYRPSAAVATPLSPEDAAHSAAASAYSTAAGFMGLPQRVSEAPIKPLLDKIGSVQLPLVDGTVGDVAHAIMSGEVLDSPEVAGFHGVMEGRAARGNLPAQISTNIGHAVRSLTSPEGIGTMIGAGSLPGGLGEAAGRVFNQDLVRGAYGGAGQMTEGLSSGDTGQVASGVTSLLLNSLLAGHGPLSEAARAAGEPAPRPFVDPATVKWDQPAPQGAPEQPQAAPQPQPAQAEAAPPPPEPAAQQAPPPEPAPAPQPPPPPPPAPEPAPAGLSTEPAPEPPPGKQFRPMTPEERAAAYNEIETKKQALGAPPLTNRPARAVWEAIGTQDARQYLDQAQFGATDDEIKQAVSGSIGEWGGHTMPGTPDWGLEYKGGKNPSVSFLDETGKKQVIKGDALVKHIREIFGIGQPEGQTAADFASPKGQPLPEELKVAVDDAHRILDEARAARANNKKPDVGLAIQHLNTGEELDTTSDHVAALGAAVLWRYGGDVDIKKFDRTMRKEFGRNVYIVTERGGKYAMDPETAYANAKVKLAEFQLGAQKESGHLTPYNEIKRFTNDGLENKDWYEKGMQALARELGMDTVKRISRFETGYSPRVRVQRSILRALDAVVAEAEGREPKTDGFNRKTVTAAWQNEPVSGDKLIPYDASKNAGLGGEEPRNTVVDTIMSRAHGFGEDVSEGVRRFVDAINRMEAVRIGAKKIQQAQAATWSGYQHDINNSDATRSWAELVRDAINKTGGIEAFKRRVQADVSGDMMPPPESAHEQPQIGLGIRHIKSTGERSDTFEVTDKEGKPTGKILAATFDPSRREVHVDWMGRPFSTNITDQFSKENVGSVGHGNVRDALRELKQHYDADTISAERVSGAREAAARKTRDRLVSLWSNYEQAVASHGSDSPEATEALQAYDKYDTETRSVGRNVMVMKKLPVGLGIERLWGGEEKEPIATGDKDAVDKLSDLLKSDKWGRHGQHVLREADEDAFLAYNRGAGSRARARFLVGKMNEAIRAKYGDEAPDRFREAMTEDNVAGRKDMWASLQDEASKAQPDDLIDKWANGWDDMFGAAANMLVPDKGARRQLKSAASRAFTNNDPEALRGLIERVFGEAADKVPDLSPETSKYMDSDEFKGAFEMSKPLRDALESAQRSNEGVVSTFTGKKSKAYWPLTALDEETGEEVHPPTQERVLRYAKQRPGTTKFRTGLSDKYDPSSEALQNRVTAALRAAGKNDTTSALVAAGLAVELPPNKSAPDTMEAVPGAHEPVVIKEVGRLQIVDGKKIPPKRIAMPASVAKEISPFFDAAGRFDESEFADTVLNAILRGYAEPAGHSWAQWGNLAHALRVTLPQAVWRSATVDMKSPEAAEQIRQLAELGVLPDRAGSVSSNATVAEDYGAKLKQKKTLAFSPFIFGPKGVDMRNRVVAGMWFDNAFPEASKADKIRFMQQLGNYVGATRGMVARAVINPAMSPFFTAGSTTIRNAAESFGIGNSLPEGTSKAKWLAREQATSGAIAAVGLWYVLNKAITGQFPHEQDNARLFAIPLSNDQAQNNPILKLFASEDPNKTFYLDMSRLFPVLDKGLRITGVKSASNALMRGADWKQAGEQAALGATNAGLGFSSPYLRVIFAAATGSKPYVIHDFQANKTSLVDAMPPDLKTLNPVTKRLTALGEEIVPQTLFAGDELFGAPSAKEQPRFPRAVANTILPGLIGSEENVNRKRNDYAKERNRAYRPRP